MEPSLELVLEYLCWALCDPERRCSPILNSGFVSCKVKLIFSCFHKFFRQLFYFNCTSESCWSGSRLVSRVATDRVKGGKLSHNDAVVQDDGGDGCQGVVQGDRSTVCEQKRVKLSMILR